MLPMLRVPCLSICVKQHYSYKSNECTFILIRKIFPDSSIAKKYSSVRIKTIVNNVLAPMSVEYALNQWCTEDFEKGKKAIRSQPNVVSEKIYSSGSKKKVFNLN